ncbi:hypothetical protein [Salinicola sp. RZ23]|uniref:hypothetical protein n=1 Tax=Salinicola sp. RZ23 TaxID=1949087 RepID=UPI000DA10D3F|nr:hypothetical protein [Salinicola sp. RZ23]
MSSINGIALSSKKSPLTHWVVVCEEWRALVDRYSRVLGGEEHIFNFTERPHLGVFSAAAWRAGFIAIEEFRYEKHSDDAEYRYGRCDLWLATDNLRRQDYIEAKQEDIHLGGKNAEAFAARTLESALSAVTLTRGDRTDVNSVGLAFFNIWCPNPQAVTSAQILDFIEEMKGFRKTLEWDLMSWTFPDEARGKYNTTKALGAVILAKRLPRG